MAKQPLSASRIFPLVLGSPALGADNAVLGDTAPVSGATSTVSSGFTQPDVPRNITVKGNAAGIAGNVVINGTNRAGQAITETIALSGTSVVAGTKSFATVTSVVLPAWTNGGTDRIRIGTGARLGLGVLLSRDTVVHAFLAGVREATRPTIAVSATLLENNTITLSSALNGSEVRVDYYEPN